MPLAHVYLRPTPTVPATRQREDAEAYYRATLAPRGFELGECFEDDAREADKPLARRRAGARLRSALRAGDVVLIARSAVAFRDRADLVRTCRKWGRRAGVRLLDLGVGTDTEEGREGLDLVERVLNVLAERHGERVRRNKARDRRMGRPTGRPPYGFKSIGPKGRRKLVPDEKAREVGRLVLALKEQGLSMERIFWHLFFKGVRRDDDTEYPPSTLWRMCQAEACLQAAEKAEGAQG